MSFDTCYSLSQTIHTEHLLAQGHLCRYPTPHCERKKMVFAQVLMEETEWKANMQHNSNPKDPSKLGSPSRNRVEKVQRAGCEGGELLFLLPRESKNVPPQVSYWPPQENRGSEGLQEEGWGSDHGGWEEPKSGKAASSVDQAAYIGSLIFASLHPSFSENTDFILRMKPAPVPP